MTTSSFTLAVDGISGSCATGERWAEESMVRDGVPVLSCEGPCIRGEIARLAANIVSHQSPYARACYAETALVPYSTMAKWVRESKKVVVIDGCFLHCMRRLVSNLARPDSIVHFDALPLHKRYSKIFHMDDVPYEDRLATARLTADRILAALKDENPQCRGDSCSC